MYSDLASSAAASAAPLALTGDMILVFTFIGWTVLLFLMEWVRVDVVALMLMVLLPMFGLVDGMVAFQGLSSNAVVSIIAVIILGAGLDHTGVINRVVHPVTVLAGRNQNRIIVFLSSTVALISSLMQNVGAAALFLPAIRRLSQESKTPLSNFLMPIGFAAILGGTMTLVGSSPLIMINDMIRPFGLEPFGLFSVMPIGCCLVATGIGYFLVFGKWVLPRQAPDVLNLGRRSDEAIYEEVGSLYEMQLDLDCKPLRIGEICEEFNVHPVALATAHGSGKMFPPDRDMVIKPGNVIAVYGPLRHVEDVASIFGFTIRPELDVFKLDLSRDLAGLAEAVIPPHAEYVGKVLSEIRFRHRYLVTPLALYRENKAYYSGLMDMHLQPGDGLLMHGSWERLHFLRKHRDFLFAKPIEHEVLRPDRALCAVSCFLFSTLLVIFSDLPLSVSLMAGAVGMILTRVLSIQEAYNSVDWRTVFLLAGLLPLGIAAQETGAAPWVAHQVMTLVGTPSPVMFFLLVGAMTTVFTLVVSNVGAMVLLAPLAIDMADAVGLDPRAAALVVALAASNSFLLPTHQVNALYMGPGKYKSVDYIRAGAPLSVLFLVVLSLLMGWFW